ncbi:GAF domain-containing protein [bacterium]|nr:GAF domain-containing protein [bacterium]MBU2461797.1 GAF domain-containing protein [bacterium]
MLGEISLWLVEEARRRLKVEVCSVMILDKEKEELIMIASMGLPKEVIAVAHGRVGKGVAGWVAAEGMPLLIRDINEDIRFMGMRKKGRYYTDSLLSLPIKKNGEMIGVLNLNNKHDHSPFSEEDLNKAMELVAEACQKLYSAEIAKLYEVPEKLKERTSELNSIFLFSQKISASLYLSEIMNAISEATLALLDPEIIIIMLFAQKRVWLFTKGEPTKPLFVRVRSHIEEKLSVLTEKSLSSEFDWTTVKMEGQISEIPTKKGFSSSISLPLSSGDKELGLVSCLRSQPFTKDELRVFAIITNTASVAVDKAILYQKLEEELDETRRELLSSEKMATVGKITGKISHDLRNPLALISLCLYILKDKVKDAEAIVYLDRIEGSYNRMNRLCEELLDFERKIELEKKEIDLHQTLRDSLAFCEHNLTKIQKILELSPEATLILVDQRRLEQVFTNIIQNASESMGEEGMLRIETKRLKIDKQDFVRVSFSDTGTGIALEIREKIFEPFFTTHSKGIGLGLAICKEIVEKHGGKIDVESKLGLGTTFNILLPI